MELVPRPDSVDDWKWNQTNEYRELHKMVMLILKLMLVDMLGRLPVLHMIMKVMQIQEWHN
jgi:hypothetical protein